MAGAVTATRRSFFSFLAGAAAAVPIAAVVRSPQRIWEITPKDGKLNVRVTAQDEINRRRSKALHISNSRRVA